MDQEGDNYGVLEIKFFIKFGVILMRNFGSKTLIHKPHLLPLFDCTSFMQIGTNCSIKFFSIVITI